MWSLKLHRINTTSANEPNENLQRFANQVDIELEGTGTFVDADIKLDSELINTYYWEYNVLNTH